MKKPVEKRPKVSNKEKEWVEVPNKKELRKKKMRPRRSPPEAVNPDELGATVQGIREKRSKEFLVQLKCSTKSRGRLDTAFKEAIGARGTVRHLIPRIEVEIADLEPTIEVEDVEDAVRSFF